MMDTLETIAAYLRNEPINKIVLSLAIIIVGIIIQRLLIRLVVRQASDSKTRFRWKKTITYSLTIITVLIVARVWFEGISSLTTFIGLMSAGLAIALKDMLADLAGWVFILWRRPFEVGNRIQIGDNSGDVIDVRPFQFTILEIGNWVKADQSTGRIVHIPNGSVFLQPLCNYDMGFKYIWNEIPVMVTFDSDWEHAKQILQAIADDKSLPLTADVEAEILKASKQYLIFYHNLTPKIYTSVAESGIVLTIRYLTEIRKRRGTTEAIWEEVLRKFTQEKHIALAYPTYRVTPDSSSELLNFQPK
ncbi:MAG: mechanosensitive ion channel domain-containing protein [Candidatus Cloacimonadota bacterium]